MANLAPYGSDQYGIRFPHQGKVVPRRAGSMWPSWQRVFLIGLLLWVASVVVTDITGNVNLIPTVVLLGSFLVPVTAVIWYLDHYESPTLSPSRIFYAFIVGGVLGILAASLLEAYLLTDSGIFAYVGVGLIEEGVKLAAVLLVARGLTRFVTRDGIVLGATVGFAFGALESAGYAFNALVVPEGSGVALSLGNLVQTELVRGILAPVGHGLWTAILGGIVFSASRRANHLRLTWVVVGAYLVVSLLHALWDSMRGIAFVLTEVLTATPQQQAIIDSGRVPTPTPVQVRVFLVFEWGGLLLISIIGLTILWALWHGASREAPPAVMPLPGAAPY